MIDGDMLEGLPAAGSNIGGAMKGIAPGAGAFIVTMGVAKGVSGIAGATAKGISKRLSGKKKKTKSKKKKTTTKTKSKGLYKKTPRYNTPLVPKMGPY